MAGEDALAALERRAYLDMMEAVAGALDVMVIHRDAADADAQPVSEADHARRIAHLASTVSGSLKHISRHVQAVLEAEGLESARYNAEHAARHVEEAQDHHGRMMDDLAERAPVVAVELDELGAAEGGP